MRKLLYFLIILAVLVGIVPFVMGYQVKKEFITIVTSLHADSSTAIKVEVIEYREGGDPARVTKLPGKTSYPDIKLKWGIADSSALYDLHLKAVNGQREVFHGSIVQLDEQGNDRVTWEFYDAWPSVYEAPTFNAKGSEIAIETMTLSCGMVVRKTA